MIFKNKIKEDTGNIAHASNFVFTDFLPQNIHSLERVKKIQSELNDLILAFNDSKVVEYLKFSRDNIEYAITHLKFKGEKNKCQEKN